MAMCIHTHVFLCVLLYTVMEFCHYPPAHALAFCGTLNFLL